MASRFGGLFADRQADRVVPPSGFTATLTVLASGAMAFLAVFSLALSLAAGRLADRWGSELSRGATVRIIATQDQEEAQINAALRVLDSTAGIQTARRLSSAEQQALLSPWFGAELDLNDLPVPKLIEVTETPAGFDAEGLRLRLAAEVPGAILDDHSRWREPLTQAAGRLRILGLFCMVLIAGTMVAIITLAANAALSANAQVIQVLRLVGATDAYIAGAFVRRFTVRAALGAAVGIALAMLALALLPGAQDAAAILTGLSFAGWHWVLPLIVPPLAAIVALLATRAAARRSLERLS
ncbi:MAG: cell division protein FtsX [Pseudomonadota bacterium]